MTYEQLRIPEWPHEFGGITYDPPRDRDRLRAQLARVLAIMRDGEWHTLADISMRTGDPQASVSARLRDLRKDKFGAHTVERDYVSRGLWRYRLDPPEEGESGEGQADREGRGADQVVQLQHGGATQAAGSADLRPESR